jgi:hypothetical protein
VSGANSTGDNPLFGELLVQGSVIWSGGTYRPHVSSEANNDSDVWHVTGTFTIPNGSTAALAPGTLDGENNSVGPPNGMHWHLILADGGFANNNRPSFDAGIWAIDPVGNPAIGWDLRSVWSGS